MKSETMDIPKPVAEVNSIQPSKGIREGTMEDCKAADTGYYFVRLHSSFR